jgi:hypothetical protein
MTIRPYTGNSDGHHPKERSGTKRLAEYLEYLFGLKSLGIYVNRNKRSSDNLSVHATWRAMDLTGKGTAKENAKARKEMVEFVVAHADSLGIEAVFAYDGVGCPIPNLTEYGAGWKCDRDAWRPWGRMSNAGSPGATWTHIEISPKMADSKDLVDQAFAKIFK